VPDGVAGLKLALELGLRDYVHKCGFSNVVLGLSGGVDSALVAVLAADALGPQNVLALSMPSRYSSEHSKSDAALLAKNLGIRYEVAPIEPMHAAFEAGLATIFAGTTPGLTEENLQARIRGAVVMAISNKFGHLALTTGNKSELSTGYCTLYGDMCGGLAVIGDVPKTSVYALCRYINQAAGGPRIPESILTKPPSAELKPNQTDQDTLPPYDLLDEILTRYVEQEKDVSQIAAAGFDADVVRRIARMVDRSEYKRRQGAPTLKVTGRAFGTGRRLPIAQRYNY
jgi:NAD+ synthetase